MKTGSVFWANKPGETAHIYRFVNFNPFASLDNGYITLHDMTANKTINVAIFWFKERNLVFDD